MPSPQQWATCHTAIKRYVNGFVALLKSEVKENLKGVYLHGSLATGSFYPPKSDLDIIGVTFRPLSPQRAQQLNYKISLYALRRPITGNLEFSMIHSAIALWPPNPPPYLLHYSAQWHDRIQKGQVDYSAHMTDIDLLAHLTVIKKRGVCLYGSPIQNTFGEPNWNDFMYAVVDDLKWILSGETLWQRPAYGILNICRSLQLLRENSHLCLNKDEGGLWGLAHLPDEYHPLIRQALEQYHSTDDPSDETPSCWDKQALLRFYDYAKQEYQRLRTSYDFL